jgi:curved DNA-binding protein CbpA
MEIDKACRLAILLLVGLTASTAAYSHYEALGLESNASATEIKRAYRRLALQWHPDKNPGNEKSAEAHFIRVSEAYSTLSDPNSRKIYDQQRVNEKYAANVGGHSDRFTFGRRTRRFDLRDAEALFSGSFGDSLWREWQPGSTVSGTLVRGGRKLSVTIGPDGEVIEESESSGDSNGAGYVYMKRRSATGSRVEIQISDMGAFMRDMLPSSLASIPVLGVFLSAVLGWTPTLLCMGCMWMCCGPRGKGKAE